MRTELLKGALHSALIGIPFLSVIMLGLSIGAVNAENMLTYTNGEYGFSIEYPEGWTVEEGYMGGVVAFMGPIKDGGIINALVGTEELPTRMTAEEYVEAARELFPVEWNVVETFTDTINGEPVAGQIIRVVVEGIESKQMQACLVSDTTAYVIFFSATESTYEEANDDWFNPMLQSFEFIDREAGIRIQNFIVAPSKVETGEEVKVKFEAVNEADVEKTKTLRLVDMSPSTGLSEEIGFKTVTLAPGETEVVEFTFIPKGVGEHALHVEDQYRLIEVTEAISVPVFAIVGLLAIVGLAAVAFLLRRRKS